MSPNPREIENTFHGPSKTITVEPLRVPKAPSLPRREPVPLPKQPAPAPKRAPAREPARVR